MILCNQKHVLITKHFVINRTIFNDGEKYITLNKHIRYKQRIVLVFLIGKMSINDALVELILILDMLRQYRARVILFVPYLFYARQDRWICTSGSVGLRTVLYTIRIMGVRKIFVIDMHKTITCAYLYNISLFPLLNKIILNKHPKGQIVFPDKGSFKRCGKTFEHTYKHSPIVCQKKRYKNGSINIRMNNKVDNKDTIVVIDDMIDTGRTLLEIYKLISKYTHKIYFYVIHGVYTSDKWITKLNTKSFNTLFQNNTVTQKRFFCTKRIINHIVKHIKHDKSC